VTNIAAEENVTTTLQLAPGKARGLQACATPEGTFAILAMDHRDSLRAIIAPDAPQTVSAERLTEIKLAIVRHLAPAASAILLDPVYSAGQAIVGGHLPGHIGLLCAMEEQGYLDSPHSRRTPLLAGWSVAKAKRVGANGIKLLMFYHPDAGPAAEAQEGLVRSLASDCRRYEMAFFLEPITYSIDSAVKKGSPGFAAMRRRLVVETVRRLSPLGPDVVKVEFPLDVHDEPDQGVWGEACAELDAASRVPWTLLSAGDAFETFKQQLRVACRAGCSGFVGGRAIWQEAVELGDKERAEFLDKVAYHRVCELREIAAQYATPWHRRLSAAHVDEDWFQEY
jgi:tagatose-1,6-bisphosphate aldolase